MDEATVTQDLHDIIVATQGGRVSYTPESVRPIEVETSNGTWRGRLHLMGWSHGSPCIVVENETGKLVTVDLNYNTVRFLDAAK